MKISKRSGTVAAAGLALAAAVAGVPLIHSAQAAHPKAATGKVAILFSDFTTSARWNVDKADFLADMKKLDPGVSVVVTDAKTNQTTENNQAKSQLTAGAKVLIVVAVDGTQAKAIVLNAHANKPSVPVVAYDRLIKDSPLDAYTSFDNFKVGVDQGTYLKNHVKAGGTIVSLAGDPGDNNAILFHAGAMSVLQPLFKSGKLKLGYDKYTPGWTASTGQAEMASALNKLNNKVDGVLAANDGLAGAAVAALKAQKLAGKIPVTGQDATTAGLQNILLGTQSMTIYKPLGLEAQAAANMTHTFLQGKKFKSATKTNNGMVNVPSKLYAPIAVTKANIKATVIKDGFVTKAELCKGIPASACSGM